MCRSLPYMQMVCLINMLQKQKEDQEIINKYLEKNVEYPASYKEYILSTT